MARSQTRLRTSRIPIAGITALVVSAVLLGHPVHSRGAGASTQPSSQVAVIPGFAPTAYGGTNGIPALPVSSPQLAAYHFTQLRETNVTAAALASYDTVLLYGIRWSDIPATGQAAINAFAATHKVVIWDADDTGAQSYSTFIHPFSTFASSEHGAPGAVVVSFPSGDDFLASDSPSSPYYLDPNRLVSDQDLVNHMNAMHAGTPNWAPGLVAANNSIPQPSWVLAWSYGAIGDHTGLVVYSGIDADGFGESATPNYAVKELALDLAAPFRQTADSSCASSCNPPPGGGGSPTPYAACDFAKQLPRHWVRGRVVVGVKTIIAAGITGKVVTRSGRVLASGKEGSNGIVRLVVPTKRLPSNRTSRLRAVIFVNGQQACTKAFRLKVDNVRPRVLLLHTSSVGPAHVVTLRVNEISALTVIGRNLRYRRGAPVHARRMIHVRLPLRVHSARLVLRDRAGNKTVRRLHW